MSTFMVLESLDLRTTGRGPVSYRDAGSNLPIPRPFFYWFLHWIQRNEEGGAFYCSCWFSPDGSNWYSNPLSGV